MPYRQSGFQSQSGSAPGRVYQDMGCFWFEEPLPPQDMDGFAELALELDMRIASGENLNTRYAFAGLIARRRGWSRTRQSRGGSTDISMLLAIPNAIYVESSGPQKIKNGEVAAPEQPGMSSEVPKAEIKKYKA